MLISILLDIVLVVILFFGMFVGFKSGLITLIFKKFRKLASLVMAILLAKPIATLFASRIVAPVSDLLMKYIGSSITDAVDLTDGIPVVLRSVMNLFGTDLTALAQDAIASGSTSEEIVRLFIDSAAVPVANVVSVVIAFLAVFFIALIVIAIVGAVINAAFSLPVLRQINKLAGALVGLAFHAVIAWLVCKLMVFLVGLFADVSIFDDFELASTYITKYFYDFDPIKFLLKIPG